MIHTTVVQVLNSSYDDGAAAGFVEHTIALYAGQTSVDVPRDEPTTTVDWSFSFVQIENTTDATPVIPALILTFRDETKATYQMAPAPDTDNYILRYRYPNP